MSYWRFSKPLISIFSVLTNCTQFLVFFKFSHVYFHFSKHIRLFPLLYIFSEHTSLLISTHIVFAYNFFFIYSHILKSTFRANLQIIFSLCHRNRNCVTSFYLCFEPHFSLLPIGMYFQTLISYALNLFFVDQVL